MCTKRPTNVSCKPCSEQETHQLCVFVFSSASDRTQNSLETPVLSSFSSCFCTFIIKVYCLTAEKKCHDPKNFWLQQLVSTLLQGICMFFFYKIQTYLYCCNINVSYYKMKTCCWNSKKFHVITRKVSCYNVISLCDVILWKYLVITKNLSYYNTQQYIIVHSGLP